MNKERAQLLVKRANEMAAAFSKTDRNCNYANEIFSVESIKPINEECAIIIFHKEPTKKKSLQLCFWINSGDGYWFSFFPKYSHLTGLDKVISSMQELEVWNFGLN